MYNNFNWPGWHVWSGWNMMGGSWTGMAFGLGLAAFIALLVAWSLVWKGMALWKSARHAHKVWFVVLLVTNTVGILDILYLYVFSKKSKPVDR